MDNRYADTFREEGRELISNLENTLLILEKEPDNVESINTIFRCLHTLKGSGSMFGFQSLASLAHELETAFVLVRDGIACPDKQLINLVFSSCDIFRIWLTQDPDLKMDNEAMVLSDEINKWAIQHQDAQSVPPEVEEKDDTQMRTYRIRFEPQANIFLIGANPLVLLKQLKALGQAAVVMCRNNIPSFDTINPELCYMSWDIVLSTSRGINAIKDIFIFYETDSSITIEQIAGQDLFNTDENYKRLGEILVEKGITDKDIIQKLLPKPIGEILIEKGITTASEVESALVEQKHVRELLENKKKQDSSSSIRVKYEKLDTLVNLTGEIVTVQAHLADFAQNEHNPELVSISEQMERLTAQLRDITMSIRMVPIALLFGNFNRLVRDLATALNKEVDLKIYGGDTELDKNIIESLKDPLLHLIRNALDHGIELPEERLRKGKKRKGLVELAAGYEGSNICIQIKDDGLGLDKDKILAKALEKGIIQSDTTLADEDIFNLIFMPGFSTASQITDVSGRGVGMDVVQSSISSLHGEIKLASSKGQGTTVTLTIPLTLAIIDGLLVTVGNNCYLLNLENVAECLEFSEAKMNGGGASELIQVKGDFIPVVFLRKVLEETAVQAPASQVVVVKVNERFLGLVVDKIIGQFQSVIKPLSHCFTPIHLFSGASILGDGTIALILDINRLEKLVSGNSNKVLRG